MAQKTARESVTLWAWPRHTAGLGYTIQHTSRSRFLLADDTRLEVTSSFTIGGLAATPLISVPVLSMTTMPSKAGYLSQAPDQEEMLALGWEGTKSMGK